MARLDCACGNTIRDNADFLPYKARLLPDEDTERAVPEDRDMFECEECGRLWIQAGPNTTEFLSYQPESARRGILSHKGASRSS